MKQIKKIKTTLFDSSEARFTLSVEGHFVKEKQDGSSSNLAYVSDNGTAIINPNIYLVFAYKGDTFEESKAIFTSFPQLFKFRDIMNTMRGVLSDPNAFVMVENALTVSPNYTVPYSVTGIGQSQNWISFSLTVVGNADGTATRGVKVQYSGINFASVLTEDEFFTIAEIIDSINLEAYKFEMSSLVILNNNFPAANTYTGQQQSSSYNRANNMRYTNAPTEQAPIALRNNNSFRQMGRQSMAPQAPMMENVTPPTTPTAPRTSNAPSFNMAAVEAEAPNFQMSLNNISDDDIDSIFGQ